MQTIIRRIAPAAWIALVLGPAAPVHGQEDDFTGVIKYRQGVMKAQAGHMAALAQLVRDRIPDPEGERMRMHARSIQALLHNLTDGFPEGSDFGETRAEERIWEQWDKFEAASEKATNAAKALTAAVEKGDRKTITEAFKKLGKACKACHEDFRAEEE